MGKWKPWIYASIAWVLFVVGISAGMVWYITAHPINEAVDEARVGKAGEVAGMLLGAGLTLIGLSAWRRGKS